MHTNRTLPVIALAALCLVLLPAAAARAVSVGDITRVEGQRINKLRGLGLVVGLKGTGDGGDFRPAIRPLAAMLERMGDRVGSLAELEDARNVALVTVTATIGEGGARPGDRIDVQVQSIGAAKSLEGGRLFICPLQGPQRNSIVYALAEGTVRLEAPDMPTVGVVDGGAVLEEEVLTDFVEGAKFRLVLTGTPGEFSTATTIADVINQDTEYEVGRPIARALDSRTIEVEVPEAYRENPVPFLARVQRLDLILRRRRATVRINERTGTIAISGDVEISPTVVSHKTLVVEAAPMATATATSQQGLGSTAVATPSQTSLSPEGPFFAIDPRGEGGARLQDLVAALNVMKVPAEDRIAIVKLLADAGQIHADVSFVE